MVKRDLILAFAIFIVNATADVNELKTDTTKPDNQQLNKPKTETPHFDEKIAKQSQYNIKELQAIKHTLDHDDPDSTTARKIEGVMSKIEAQISELEQVSPQDYSTKVTELDNPSERSRTSLSSVSTVLENFLLNDGYTAHDTSQKILVAINPASSTSNYHERLKRNNEPFLSFNPLFINQELIPKAMPRREINNQNPYIYQRPSITFLESPSAIKKKEYLPPLESSSADINIIKQPFHKENGYEYKRPDKPFLLPNESKNVPTIVSTSQKPTTNVYIPPLQNSAAENVPSHTFTENGYNYKKPEKLFNLQNKAVTVDLKSITPTTTKNPVSFQTQRPILVKENGLPPPEVLDVRKPLTDKKYPPVLEPSSANNVPTTVLKEEGYNYPKPSIPFLPPSPVQPSATNKLNSGIVSPTSTTPKSNGYTYPLPTVDFFLPSTKRRPFVTAKTTTKYQPVLEPSNSDGGKVEISELPYKGYKYPKPNMKFETGLEASNTNESPSFHFPKQKFDPVNGYDYPVPTIKFETFNKDYFPPKSNKPIAEKLSVNPIFEKLQPINRLSEDLKSLTKLKR